MVEFSEIEFHFFFFFLIIVEPSLIPVVLPESDLPVDNFGVVKWKGNVLRCEATFQFI